MSTLYSFNTVMVSYMLKHSKAYMLNDPMDKFLRLFQKHVVHTKFDIYALLLEITI